MNANIHGHQRGMGSGMILDKEGHILTNYHVVRDMDDIKVQLADGRKFEAEIVGTDPQTDVAIIKIKGQVPDDLPTITLGDSDGLQVGNLVLAVGAPFGLLQTVTSGIISATGRARCGLGRLRKLPANRRRNQSRQLGRPFGEYARRGDWNE